MTRSSVDINSRNKRLLRELKDITENPPPLVSAQLKNGEISRWLATIEGPPGTPYEGGNFKLSLRFPPDYPLNAPYVSK